MLPQDNNISRKRDSAHLESADNDFKKQGIELTNTSFNDISFEKVSVQTQSLLEFTLNPLGKLANTKNMVECAPVDSAYSWVILVCATLNMIFIIGINNSFGIFSTYYINFIYPDVSAADISWIGTTIVFCMLSVSIFIGPLTDKLGFRLISLAGSFICGVALTLASFTSTVWQLVLTQGIMYGIGAGFIYSPSIFLTSQWHKKNRSLAIGITVAGIGVGGMIVSEITQRLMEAVGYSWTLRVLALIIFCMCGTAASFYKRRVSIPREGVDFMIIAKDTRLIVIGITGLFVHVGIYMIRSYLQTAALMFGQSEKASNKLAIYLSAGSTVGRIVSSYAAIAFGSINSIFISYTLCSVLILVAMLAIKSMAAYIALAIIYGAISVSYVSVVPLMIAEMFGAQKVPTAIGIMNAWNSIGAFIGNPSQGAIYQHLDRPNSSFTGITIWGATSLFLAACSFVGLKAIVIRSGPHRIWSKL